MKRSRHLRPPQRRAAGPVQSHPANAAEPASSNDGLDAPLSRRLEEALVYTWAALLAVVSLIAVFSALRAAT